MHKSKVVSYLSFNFTSEFFSSVCKPNRQRPEMFFATVTMANGPNEGIVSRRRLRTYQNNKMPQAGVDVEKRNVNFFSNGCSGCKGLTREWFGIKFVAFRTINEVISDTLSRKCSWFNMSMKISISCLKIPYQRLKLWGNHMTSLRKKFILLAWSFLLQ